MRKNAVVWRRVIAVVVALLIIPMTTGVSTSHAAATTQPYDGETIFRGILLNDGPVAKLFPEIWGSSRLAPYLKQAEDRASATEIAAAKQKIVDLLKAQDPTFFDRFGTEMRSGDHIRIQLALKESSTRLQKEVESSAAADNPNIVPTVLYVYIYVALVLALAIVLVVAIAAALDEEAATGSASNLRRDVYVDLIAQRLGPQAAK
jgi:SdpC family antimicrobial peptide